MISQNKVLANCLREYISCLYVRFIVKNKANSKIGVGFEWYAIKI